MVGYFLHHCCHIGYHIVNLQKHKLDRKTKTKMRVYCGDVRVVSYSSKFSIILVMFGGNGVTLLQLLNHIYNEVALLATR